MDKILVIVIPCYNEYNRINVNNYKAFLEQNSEAKIVFSNDGSRDNTAEKLEEIQSIAPEKVYIHTLDKNKGKAEAVREGILYCFENQLEFDRIAYLDADGSTTFEDCFSISRQINDKVKFAFGSRIMKIDTFVKRKFYRHLIGRIVASIISGQLQLGVYDSQCGCKVFSAELAKEIFKDGFISKWLFDVEIFHRMIKLYGRENMPLICREIPLNSWIDTADSRVSFTYFFKMWFDILRIRRKYKSY